jgi:SAM-dependent methyltransferase
MANTTTEALAEVAAYYAAKLAAHGQTARGVDWNGEESQQLRFAQLLKVSDGDDDFALNDLGCGYGALYDYLRTHDRRVRYSGFDISAEMIDIARTTYPGSDARWVVAGQPDQVADYAVASGIFNVRLNCADDTWLAHIETIIEQLHLTSSRGFAFNCLTAYSDAERMRDYRYYADPCRLFDLCKRRYSRHVALLHDYGLYEFTIVVKKF